MLPTPLSWIRKVLRILKSNLSPNQIALAFALGVFAGLPPMGLHVIVPCTLALLLRCSFRSFLISMGLSKLISLAVAPGSYAVGRWLLDSSRGIDAFWRWLFHLPVLAPMGYERYLLLGSLTIALGIAIPAFIVVRLLVKKYRGSFAVWVSGWRVSGVLRDNLAARRTLRFLAGGEAKYATEAPPRGLFRVVRRGMLIGIPILYAAAYLLAGVIVPFFAGNVATSAASWVVGAEVGVADSSFSLFTGALRLHGLWIEDPKSPSENLIEIPEITLDVGMVHFLENRVVFDRVRIADASLHVVREEDGTLNIDNPTSGWNAAAYADWALEYAGRVDWLGLLRRFLDALADIQPLEPRDDPATPYRGGRSFEAFKPPFAIRRLEVGRVGITLRDDHARSGGPFPPLTLLEVELTNLALPAARRTGPVSLRLHGQLGDDPDSTFTLSASFSIEAGRSIHRYDLKIARVDLTRWASFHATTLPVRIQSGYATATAILTLTRAADGANDGRAEGTVSLLVEELQLAGDSGRPLFDLPAETSDGVIEGINRYAAEVPLVIGFPIGGTSAEPSFEWEAPLLEAARQGLLMLGKREAKRLADDLGGRITALGGLPDVPLEADYGAVQQAAQGVVLNLLGGALPGDVAPASPGARQEASPTPEDVIRSLFRRLAPEEEQPPEG